MFSISPSALLRFARSLSGGSSKTKSQLKILNAVYMIFTVSKFILRMLYSIMSFGSVINQSIIGFPVIRVYSRAIKLAILR